MGEQATCAILFKGAGRARHEVESRNDQPLKEVKKTCVQLQRHRHKDTGTQTYRVSATGGGVDALFRHDGSDVPQDRFLLGGGQWAWGGAHMYRKTEKDEECADMT